MSRPVLREAIAHDDAGIRALLRREILPGRISVSMEREPDYFAGCRLIGGETRTLVAEDEATGEIVALACRAVLPVCIHGAETRVGYLGQLRIDSRYRGQWLLARGFACLKAMHDADPLPAYLVSIIAGNDEAEGVLVRHPRRGFPVLTPLADFCTYAIPTARAEIPQQNAPPPDLDEAFAFLQTQRSRRQLCYAWTRERFTAHGLTTHDLHLVRAPNGAILGLAALWDQANYKQTIVRGYSGWLRTLAPLYNVAAPAFGRPPLPAVGAPLRSAYVSLLTVLDHDAKTFTTLLNQLSATAKVRGLDYLLLGLDTRNPLTTHARRRPHVPYLSKLYLAQWPGSPTLPPLKDQPVHVEIATL